MVVDEDTNRLVKKQDLIHLTILLAIALGIGIYLIVTTVLIAKDGVRYIGYAKGLIIDPVGVIKGDPNLPPGYPALILTLHKVVGLFRASRSVETWILSAQCATLLCRLFALIALYLTGRLLVGPRMSFWAVFILIILPIPARFGSDALRDWPYLLFLATGFLLLLWGGRQGALYMFGTAGLVAGLGYLIRPECGQLVLYAVLWLTWNLCRAKRQMTRAKLLLALMLILASFALPVALYMKATGIVLPYRLRHLINSFSYDHPKNGIQDNNIGPRGDLKYLAGFEPDDFVEAFSKVINSIGETLMWGFLPILALGSYHYFRKRQSILEKFLVTAFIILNVAILVSLYCQSGYISRRHSLPLVAFTIFYVPIGLQVIATWLAKLFFEISDKADTIKNKPQLWFSILLIVGVAFCLPKLFRPIRIEKKGYRTVAEWLKENTAQEDLIAVPDHRIGFYAERPTIEILGDKIPKKAKYIVKIVKSRDGKLTSYQTLREEHSLYVDERNKKRKLIIYKIM